MKKIFTLLSIAFIAALSIGTASCSSKESKLLGKWNLVKEGYSSRGTMDVYGTCWEFLEGNTVIVEENGIKDYGTWKLITDVGALKRDYLVIDMDSRKDLSERYYVSQLAEKAGSDASPRLTLVIEDEQYLFSFTK